MFVARLTHTLDSRLVTGTPLGGVFRPLCVEDAERENPHALITFFAVVAGLHFPPSPLRGSYSCPWVQYFFACFFGSL